MPIHNHYPAFVSYYEFQSQADPFLPMLVAELVRVSFLILREIHQASLAVAEYYPLCLNIFCLS